MRIHTVIKNDAKDGIRFSVDCFANFLKHLPGKPLRTLHKHKKSSRTKWLDTGIVKKCALVERWRYDTIFLNGEMRLTDNITKSVIQWDATLCYDIEQSIIHDGILTIKKAQLIAVEVTPIIVRVSIFHNDNPIPEA